MIHDYKIMFGADEAAEVAPLADRLIAKLGQENISSFSFDAQFSSTLFPAQNARARKMVHQYISSAPKRMIYFFRVP